MLGFDEPMNMLLGLPPPVDLMLSLRMIDELFRLVAP